MIINRRQMLQIEMNSGLSASEIMAIAGRKLSEFIEEKFPEIKKILILAGNGNNGGDALAVAGLLRNKVSVSVYLVNGKPKTEEALEAMKQLDSSLFIREYQLEECIDKADVILDGVFGFSYHGRLNKHVSEIFRMANRFSHKVVSIDINSGCECDSGYCDSDAIISKYTCALQYRKPFHALRKEHHMFEKCFVLDIGLPEATDSTYMTMNEDIFFSHFPRKKENDYKGTHGKTLLIGGSYGMAGALAMNITGARTLGTSYLEVGISDSIYPVVAPSFFSAVFHPFSSFNKEEVLLPVIRHAKAVGYGSGCTNLENKTEIMDMVLLNANCPVVLDAEALRQLVNNTYLLRFVHVPLVLTPHIGEFAALLNRPKEYVQEHREECAVNFSLQFQVYVVLKGSNTIVISPDGRKYINESGCPALAQAGSGDLLTGMITALLTVEKDIFTAVTMAVWLHGYLSEYGLKYHSMQNFSLECYPSLMDELFRSHGY